VGSVIGDTSVVLGCFDDPVLGQGLASLLQGDRHVRVLGHDLDDSTLELALAQWAPRVTILTSSTEPSAFARLRSAGHGTRLLVLGYELSSSDGMRIFGAGANCVALGAPDVDVLAAVHDTARGERFFARRDGRRVKPRCPDGVEQLTGREREVLALLVAGATYKQVAHVLGIRVRTAEKHAASLRSKLGVRRNRELEGISPE
jgi:DNA-binding NarL/FixJ family response regulator